MSKVTEPDDVLLDVAAEYLKSLGVDVLVIGGIAVQHESGARALNHQLVVRFTGQVPGAWSR